MAWRARRGSKTVDDLATPDQPAPSDRVPATAWQPIVVGRAGIEFEPKPSRLLPPRPDTAVDGWSTGDLTLRAASVRGYAHRYAGTPRQDEFAVAVHAGGTIAVAVADGVSSAAHSHVGSALACRYAVEFLLNALDRGSEPIDWAELLRGAAYSLVDYGRRTFDADAATAERLLATTLVTGLVIPAADGSARATLVQVGDSGGWLLDDTTFTSVLGPKFLPDDTYLATQVTGLPRVPDPIVPVDVTLTAGQALLLGTDGFGDPLGSGDGEVGQLFAQHLATVPAPLAFAHLLDFSRETFDDDRTLVAVWPAATRVAGR